MALVNGFDPHKYLNLDMAEVVVVNKVISQAQELMQERKKKEIEALGTTIANNIGKMFR